MDGIKDSGQAVGAQVLTELSGFAPPTIMAQAARLQARQRLFNVVVTNVPGPQFPLYIGGSELQHLYPMVPLAENTALGIAIMSYNGQLNFGLTADYDALSDAETLADELRASIDELTEAAGTPGPKPPAPRSGAEVQAAEAVPTD
jgi:diacylglycerol O-acyltransferase / wax synthase